VGHEIPKLEAMGETSTQRAKTCGKGTLPLATDACPRKARAEIKGSNLGTILKYLREKKEKTPRRIFHGGKNQTPACRQ